VTFELNAPMNEYPVGLYSINTRHETATPLRTSCGLGEHLLKLSANISAEPSTVTFELESSKELNIIINANSIAETSINSPDALYLHILHCVADAVSLKKIQDAADVLERDEIFNIKSQVFFALSSSKNI
jgi:hypothetical protein